MGSFMLMLVGVPLFVGCIAAFLIAKQVHDSLMMKNNPNYVGLSVLAFIGSLIVIGGLTFLLMFALF